MTETPPLQCLCGQTAFVDIRVNAAGVMSLTCFQCRAVMHYSVPVVMAEQAWAGAQGESPELAADVAPEPQRPERYGYKYGGLL